MAQASAGIIISFVALRDVMCGSVKHSSLTNTRFFPAASVLSSRRMSVAACVRNPIVERTVRVFGSAASDSSLDIMCLVKSAARVEEMPADPLKPASALNCFNRRSAIFCLRVDLRFFFDVIGQLLISTPLFFRHFCSASLWVLYFVAIIVRKVSRLTVSIFQTVSR